MSDAPDELQSNRARLLEALEAWGWDFEKVAQSMAYLPPHEAMALAADNARLRAALLSVEYGSCDGCGNLYMCAECGTHNPERSASECDGLHSPTCLVGVALGRARKP